MKNRFIRYEFEIFFSIRFNMIGIKIEFDLFETLSKSLRSYNDI